MPVMMTEAWETAVGDCIAQMLRVPLSTHFYGVEVTRPLICEEFASQLQPSPKMAKGRPVVRSLKAAFANSLVGRVVPNSFDVSGW